MSTVALEMALNIAIVAVSLALLPCGWRLIVGPHSVDRVLAIDTLYINAVALIVLLGIRLDTPMLFEAALVVAMLGFVSTVAMARYLTRGDVIE
ncbi:MAG: K+/H+ antiporter subunit F [Polaromonas sp.]|jgi:multicomponent K+:H+ antiporter subunit F